MLDSTARKQRAAQNQSIFRELNERLEELGDASREDARFVCECASVDCIQPLELTIGDYERVRSDGSTFVVALGHVYPNVERVVEEDDRFTVVQKIGAGGELAQAHHPRRETADVSTAQLR